MSRYSKRGNGFKHCIEGFPIWKTLECGGVCPADLADQPAHLVSRTLTHRQLGRAQVLEELIKHRWGAIDDTQREGIKNYLSNLIIKISSDEVTLRREKVFLNKLNILLVQVCAKTFTQVISAHVTQSRMSTDICQLLIFCQSLNKRCAISCVTNDFLLMKFYADLSLQGRKWHRNSCHL